jgi:hypothetical protein
VYNPLPINESKIIKALEQKFGQEQAQSIFLRLLQLPYLNQLAYFSDLQSSKEMQDLSSKLGVRTSVLKELAQRVQDIIAGSDLDYEMNATITLVAKEILSAYDRGLEYRPALFHLIYSAFKMDFIFTDEAVVSVTSSILGETVLDLSAVWRMHDEIIYNTLRKDEDVRTHKRQGWQLLSDLCSDLDMPPESYQVLQSLSARILT